VIYVYRVTGPGGAPLDLPRRILPNRNFVSWTAAHSRAAALRDQHGVQAEVQRSLPVQFPEPGGDGAVRPSDGPPGAGQRHPGVMGRRKP